MQRDRFGMSGDEWRSCHPKENSMNVVLIVSDTLRSDHLGCYGNTTINTPNIDKLAGELRSVEEPHFSTVTSEKWSFLYATENYPAQLYDLEQDPSESSNVIGENWTIAEEMHRKLIELLTRVGTDDKYLSERSRFLAR